MQIGFSVPDVAKRQRRRKRQTALVIGLDEFRLERSMNVVNYHHLIPFGLLSVAISLSFVLHVSTAGINKTN